jgi:hypothetical protein
MAAVLCLVMIPLFASIGFMFGVVGGDFSGVNAIAGIAFFLLASFILLAALHMARGWDEST